MTRPAESVHPLPLPDECFRQYDRPCGSLHPRSECSGEWLGERWSCKPCRLAATTPPPVRVVRLRGDHPTVRGPWAMAQAIEAAAIGATTVEYITHGGNGYPDNVARELATIAARHARRALGASS